MMAAPFSTEQLVLLDHEPCRAEGDPEHRTPRDPGRIDAGRARTNDD